MTINFNFNYFNLNYLAPGVDIQAIRIWIDDEERFFENEFQTGKSLYREKFVPYR